MHETMGSCTLAINAGLCMHRDEHSKSGLWSDDINIYNPANRLTAVNGQPYTWDNNGNLTNDGSKTYLYNQANQLTGITATGLAWSATYNGDGVRYPMAPGKADAASRGESDPGSRQSRQTGLSRV